MKNNEASASSPHDSLMDDLLCQRAYVERQQARRKTPGIVFADAFLRGIRDLGYKSPATALNELFDNAIQAGATLAGVVFGFKGKSEQKPTQLAVVDNGHGMSPEMMRYAVAWGGTHRENDRRGFGRYGYGLPSSAVSIACRYSVYSKERGGSWHALTIDLHDLAARAEAGDVELPQSRPAALPAFLAEHVLDDRGRSQTVGDFASATAIVLEELDRLPSGWVQTAVLRDKLRKQLGVVYRHLIPATRLFVQGEPLEAVDPLFLLEHGRFFRETPVQAQAIPVSDVEVEVSRGVRGRVHLRAAFLPANFALADPQDALTGAGNRRLPIMEEYNGLLVCRAGRQIDCLNATPWTRFQNSDAHIKIEIDFDPVLDEFFGITTTKQQVTIAEAMWSRLQAAGLRQLFIDLRKEYARSCASAEAAALRRREGPRPSEQAMLEADKLRPRRPPLSPQKAEQARENLQHEALRLSEQTGLPLAEALKEKEREAASHPFRADFRAIPEGPFYRCERLGTQRRLIINTQHPFYAGIYNAPDSSPEIQSALEVLLFVLADAELDAEGALEEFYQSARLHWSLRLTDALKKLDPDHRLRDKAAALAAALAMDHNPSP